MDSDYFKKKYLNIDKLLQDRKDEFYQFKDMELEVNASAFYPSLEPFYNEGELPFLRVADVDRNIDYENCIKIPTKIAESLDFSTLKIINKGDIVITKGGSIGRIGLIKKKTAVTRDLIFINSSTLTEPEYKYLYVYLTTDFAFDQFIRSSSMTAQPHLTITLIRNIHLFKGSNKLINKVGAIYDCYENSYEKSQKLYLESSTLLIKTLGLSSLRYHHQSVNIKNFKESFLITGRLDAEYYQPKFDEIVNKIKLQPYSRLTDLVYINKSIEPGSNAYQESGLPFYRVSNLTKFGLTEPDIHIDKREYNDIIRPKKDTILLTKDGTVGMAYKVTEDIEGITSGAILHLNIKEDKQSTILPDYLTLVLNSEVVQLQAERDAGGSIIKHWKPSEIEEVVIPIVNIETQQQIANLAQESFKLKAESEQLLDDAIKLVEYAIEHGEDKALTDYELGLIN